MVKVIVKFLQCTLETDSTYAMRIGCSQSLTRFVIAMVGTQHQTGKQPIGMSLLGHDQWTKRL